jgi:hypothetical protein
VGRDKDPKMAAKVQESHCRDRARANNPANSGLFAENQEISVRPRVRGGAERCRTFRIIQCLIQGEGRKSPIERQYVSRALPSPIVDILYPLKKADPKAGPLSPPGPGLSEPVPLSFACRLAAAR